MVRRALLILRHIPSSIRPIPSSINLTVNEYDNEGNDEKRIPRPIPSSKRPNMILNEMTSNMNDEQDEF